MTGLVLITLVLINTNNYWFHFVFNTQQVYILVQYGNFIFLIIAYIKRFSRAK